MNLDDVEEFEPVHLSDYVLAFPLKICNINVVLRIMCIYCVTPTPTPPLLQLPQL